MGHLRCERAVCAGLDEGAVDPLDSAYILRRGSGENNVR